MNLRVGIIGAGQAGERHAVGFAATPGATLVGIADVVETRASALAGRYGVPTFTDWRRMLDQGLDILVVSLPHNLHVAPAEAAAAQGVHVLMEKPIATTIADGERIVAACAAGGVKLSLSFVHRFRDELKAARRWLDEGQFGQPHLACEVMNSQGGAHLPSWVTQKEAAGGGVLMYGAVHGVDRLRWLLGSEVATVNAQTRRFDPNTEVEEGIAALLTFANGTTATLTANAPAYWAQPAHWETQIYGSAGMVRVRTRHWAELSNNQMATRLETHTAASRLGEHYNFARQAEAFVAAITADREPWITGQDGLAALKVCLAIYRSAETGQPIQLASSEI
jgi:predicted dehydrogenase